MPVLEDLLTDVQPPAAPADTAPLPDVPDAPAQQAAQPETPAAPPSFSSSSLYNRAQAAGLPLDGIDSSDKFAETVLDAYIASRPYADFGRSNLASGSTGRLAQGVQQGEGGKEEGKESEGGFDFDGHFGSLWSAPQIDAQSQFLIDNGIVELGENGLFQAKQGYEAMALPVLNTLNQAHVAQKEQVQKLFQGNFYKNIYEALMPALKHSLSSEFTNLSQEAVKTYEQQAFEEKFIDQNKSWLYNPAGQLTAEGAKFRDAVSELRQQGINDPKRLADWAMKLSGVNTQPTLANETANTAPPPPGDQRQRDEQGKFIKGSGTTPPEPPKQESFIDSARKKAAASSNQNPASPENYKAENDGELDNMWASAWKRHMAAA